MTTYNWSTLTDGQTLNTIENPFNPSTDVLRFDDAAISAADITFDSDGSNSVFSVGGKTVTLQGVSPYTWQSDLNVTFNVQFVDGSRFIIGDDTVAIPDSVSGGVDDGPNTKAGGSGDDFIIGAGGADSLFGGSGNDLFPIVGDAANGIYGNDTINGGSGGQDRIDYVEGNSFGVIVNLGNETQNGSAIGGDDSIGGSPSTLTLIGIEAATGTSNADTFNANSAVRVNGLLSDITQRFEGMGGNDTINGATANGQNTLLEYTHSPNGVNVNLAAGTASDGHGGTDTFNNIDGVIGSAFADNLTGNSLSKSVNGGLFELFEGMGGNDTINGGTGTDRVQYDNSPAAVNVNLATGTASDGWGGTDTLINIEQVRGSSFADTLTGSGNDEQFEGGGGNDTIDGGSNANGDDMDYARYSRATGAVYVNLGAGTAQGIGGDNGVGVDTLLNIEAARGSDFNDSLVGGGAGSGDSHVEFFQGEAGNDTLNGGDVDSASIDVASYRNDPSAVIVNLSGSSVISGAFTVTGGTARDGFGVNGNPAGIDTLVNINGAEGSSFNDTLVGGSGEDHFVGRNGNDSIVGGGGIDWVHYSDSPSRTGGSTNGVIVNLDTANVVTVGADTVQPNSALDGWTTSSTDTLNGIENVEGSDFNDFIRGDNSANWLEGGAGNDTLVGGFATDTVNDTIMGGDGDDVIRVTVGADYLDGGDGFNDLLVFNNPQGTASTGDIYGGEDRVIVNLGYDPDFGTVDHNSNNSTAHPVATVVNVEQVWGTAGDDVLTGGSLARSSSGNFLEVFRGGPGNDVIDGQGGGFGGRAFNDRVEYDGISSLDTPSGGVNVNLATGTASDGRGGTDTLFNIDWVVGTSFNDTLTGGNAASNDFERFEGRGGNDLINGGSGSDEAAYQSSPFAVNVNLGTGIAHDGWDSLGGGIDTLISIERVRGSNFNDTLTGGNNNELFIGESGNDTIDGGGGIDFASWQTRALTSGGVFAFIQNGSGSVNDGFGTDTLINIEGLAGSNSNDTLTGGLGDQWFRGRGGSDRIDGGEGMDTVDYSTDPGAVVVNLGTNTATDGWGGVYAMQGTDTLFNIENVLGSDFADSITGDGNANLLNGGAGNDTLTGGAGNDQFVYAIMPGAGNVKLVTDFAGHLQGGGDLAVLDGSTLAGLGTSGELTAALFVQGAGVTAAQNSTQRIAYDTTTGDLYYDADGAGGTAAVKIMTLHNAGTTPASVDNTDFDVLNGGTVYVWSALSNGANLAFDPNTDRLQFDQNISAASLSIDGGGDGPAQSIFTFGGKTITLGTDPFSLTTTNVVFDNGSQLKIGDNTTGTANDDAANTLVGGAGNDMLIGAGGADSLAGNGGNDVFPIAGGDSGGFGNDTINGGGGGQDRIFYFSDTAFGVTVNLGNETASGSATGGDDSIGGSPSTLTLIGIEAATGTDNADTFNANSSVLVNGLRSDITQRFEGAGGNDTINGAIGDGRNTLIEYAGSPAGVSVNLQFGIATDGYGNTDSFNNIDGVIGSAFNDTLVGGGQGRSVTGGLNEFFEGLGGNDNINGLGGTDQVRYDLSPSGVNVTLANGSGTAQDGWGGTDTLFNIERVRGSDFNDTLSGGDGDQAFEGQGGNDIISGGAGEDEASYQRSTEAVYVNLGSGIGRGLADSVTGGTVGVDSLNSIEDVRGSDFADSLVGGGLGGDETVKFESFEGLAGNDTLDGGDSDPASIDIASYLRSPSGVIVNLSGVTVLGVASNTANDGYGVNGNPAGIDTLVNLNGAEGSSFNDTLVGGSLDDHFSGRNGNDSIDGGLGNDWVHYGDSPSRTVPSQPNGVIVNLDIANPLTVGTETVAAGSALDGWTATSTDTLNSIENVEGTDFNDFIRGSDAANVLQGDGGNDTLIGGFQGTDIANDTMMGGDGDDVIRQSKGADYMDGGDGFNDLLTFNNPQGTNTSTGISYGGTTGVNVNLGAGTADYDTSDGANPVGTVVNIEQVWGTVGDDVLTGGSLARSSNGTFVEVYRGGPGNDVIDGQGGGAGGRNFLDRVEYDGISSADTLSGGVNVNLATGTASDGRGGTDTLFNIDWVVGTSFNDTLTGGNAASNDFERFEGRGGNDLINGGSGIDDASYQSSPSAVNVNLATGTASDGFGGTDTLISIERVRGSNFADTLTGGNNNELFIGEGGNDTIDGGGGIDFASWQTRSLDNGGINAFIQNGLGTVNDGFGTDTLINIEGLAGSNSNDTLTGGLGDQWFRGRGGSDLIDGGEGGMDTVDYSTDPGAVVVNLGTHTATDGWGGVYAMQGTDTLFNIENVLGSDFADSITGDGGNNTLDGGAGNDSMSGGAGDDTYVVDAAGDVVTEGASAGIDTVLASVTYTLGANIENLTLTGVGNINGTGNGLDNVLTGNSGNNTLTGDIGNDTLDGGAGNDTLIGGADNDTYVVDASGDVVTEGASAGTDTVLASATYTLGANIENLTLTGVGNINGTGNTLFNVMTGNSGNNTLDGGVGNDSMSGGAGDDTYVVDTLGDVVTEGASAGTDTVQTGISGYTLAANVENLTLTGVGNINGTGNGLDNVITGNSGANTLDGGVGNDTLDGGAGIDTMFGGAGDDTYVVDATGDVVAEGGSAGTDTVLASATYTLTNNIENLTLTGVGNINGTGNGLDNVVTGNSGSNTLIGGNGNDTLDGGAGIDTMFGGGGNDTYVVDASGDVIGEGASAGTDTVLASSTYTLGVEIENLTLTGVGNINGTGNTLANVLTGNSGNNTLNGGAGIDTMFGGGGNDTYVVDALGDVVTEDASAGTDTVQTGISGYTLAANVENLTLTGTGNINGTGNTLANVLTGNSGNNTLDGGAGNDTLNGGAGNDTYVVDASGDVIGEAASAGTDTVLASATYTLTNNIENLTLTGVGNINGTGNGLDNVVTGNSGSNTLIGGNGNDTLDGGAGIDTMFGGGGNDTYVVDASGDVIGEGASAGTDTVLASSTYTLGVEIENLTLTGSGNIAGTGNTLANVLTGNSGNNTLNGGAGIDTMFGGAGDDTYVVDATGDVVAEGGSAGTDTVLASATYTLTNNIENLTLTGVGNINGTGNGLDNVVTGNSGSNTLIGGNGNDTLDGGAGIDTMFGGGGNDTYVVDASGDVIGEGASAGTDTVLASSTYTLGVEIENLTLTGVGNINGTGNTLANVLTGNSGNNTLNGGAGIDTMFGGGGNDTYVVDALGDVVTEDASAGTDTVQTGISGYTLAANVENLTLTGTGNINGTGNTLANVLTGNSGNNTLDGGAGNDTLNGGAGNDTYVVDASGDVIGEAASAGTDTVLASATYTLTNNIENLTLTGVGNINGTGNGLDNVVTGNSGSNTLIGGNGNDTLDGGAGIDTMFGGGGNDTYVVDASGDVIGEGASAGTDTVLASSTYTLGVEIENLTLTGVGNINGTGNGLDNVITGNSGNNTLTGDIGNDTLDGGAGIDTMFGGAGDDTLVYDAADGSINGGTETLADVLRIDGSGQVLNLAGLSGTTIQGIEAIDLTGTGNNQLTLTAADVLAISSTSDVLRVDGNAGDVVNASGGWVQGADQPIGINTYHSYTQITGTAQLLIDTDIAQIVT